MAHNDVVYLVELDQALRVRDWVNTSVYFSATSVGWESTSVTFADAGGVASRTLPRDVFIVSSVEEGGTALTEQTTQALMEATHGTWYWDASTHKLWINATDGDDPAANYYIAVTTETLAREQTIVKARNGVDVTWSGRVVEIPSIGQALTVEEPGAGAVPSFGDLVIQNQDGRYDTVAGQRLLFGRDVRIYRGAPTGTFASFTLWLRGTMDEPRIGLTEFHVPITSLVRKLDAPLMTCEFGTAAYPALDPKVAGFNIPRVWGTVKQAEAFRVAVGTWKLSGSTMGSIDAAYTADGLAVTIIGTNTSNGTFTATSGLDVHDRLYADCVGKATTLPGAVMADLCTLGGIASSQVLSTSLTDVDTDRAVNVGIQLRTGSVREALDQVARSAFVDWYVDRENRVAGKVRKRFAGNIVSNSGFETDVTGWSTANGATLARTTAYKFRGAASGQIVKPAAQGQAYVSVETVTFEAGKRYAVSLMAAVVSGTTALFRIGVVDAAGTEYLSDPVTLSATAWTRVHFVTIPNPSQTVMWDSTSVTFDSTSLTFSLGVGSVRIYPEYGGAGDVTVVVDEVDAAKVIAVDDTVAWFRSAETRGPVLWRARSRYAHSVLTGDGPVASQQDADILKNYPTAESRTIGDYLVCATHAETVAQAALDYFGVGRQRITVDVLAPTEVINFGSVLDVDLSRRPVVPGSPRLYRVVGLNEEHRSASVQVASVTAEALYDPIWSQETIVAE